MHLKRTYAQWRQIGPGHCVKRSAQNWMHLSMNRRFNPYGSWMVISTRRDVQESHSGKWVFVLRMPNWVLVSITNEYPRSGDIEYSDEYKNDTISNSIMN